MRRLLPLILSLVMLVGCTAAKITLPPNEPSSQHNPTTLLRAALHVGGEQFELYLDTPEKNQVHDVTGDLLLEFSAPVDLSSLVDNEQFSYANSEKTMLIAPLSGWVQVMELFTELRDATGEPVSWGGEKLTLTRIPYPRASITILGYPHTPLGYGTVLAPGETIRMEFEGDVIKDYVIEQVRAGVFSAYSASVFSPIQWGTPRYSLEWISDRVLHLTVHDSINSTVGVRADRINLYTSFQMVPMQNVAVVGAAGEVLSRIDVPLSMFRPIGMNSDYSEARLIRSYERLDWPRLASDEYTLNLSTGKIARLGDGLSAYGWTERYAIYDWMKESRRAYGRFEISYRACGLSNDKNLLAAYYYQGELWMYDLTTGKKSTLPITAKPRDDGDEPSPHWLYWSMDDTRLFYNALLPESLELTLYTFDLGTGRETPFIAGHYLLHASPFSEHLFTRSYLEDYSSYSLSIVGYSGGVHELSRSPEHVTLAKWIDEHRVLLNKSSMGQSDWQCYIYHLSDNRWEYLAEGYGFDFDSATGRVFLLQAR